MSFPPPYGTLTVPRLLSFLRRQQSLSRLSLMDILPRSQHFLSFFQAQANFGICPRETPSILNFIISDTLSRNLAVDRKEKVGPVFTIKISWASLSLDRVMKSFCYSQDWIRRFWRKNTDDNVSMLFLNEGAFEKNPRNSKEVVYHRSHCEKFSKTNLTGRLVINIMGKIISNFIGPDIAPNKKLLECLDNRVFDLRKFRSLCRTRTISCKFAKVGDVGLWIGTIVQELFLLLTQTWGFPEEHVSSWPLFFSG